MKGCAAPLASIRQMKGQVSRGSAGDYQADERAGSGVFPGEYRDVKVEVAVSEKGRQ